MKNFLKYYIKERLSVIGIITTICVIISVISLLNSEFIVRDGVYIYGIDEISYYNIASDTQLGIFSTLACILVLVVPIFEFKFKMSKITVDQMYSLPIKREKLFITKYIIGLIDIIIPISVAYFITVIWILLSKNLFTCIYYLPFYFVLLFTIIISYTIIVFAFTRGNTIIDGIINIAMYCLALFFLTLIIDRVISTRLCSYFTVLSPIVSFTTLFENLLMMESHSQIPTYKFSYDKEIFIGIIVNFVLAAVLGFLFIYLNKRDKSENSMQKSYSWFSYKVFIPYYLTVLCLLFASDSILIIPILSLIGGYLMYAIYNRSFKITWKQALIIVGTVIVSSCLSFALDELSEIYSSMNSIV